MDIDKTERRNWRSFFRITYPDGRIGIAEGTVKNAGTPEEQKFDRIIIVHFLNGDEKVYEVYKGSIITEEGITIGSDVSVHEFNVINEAIRRGYCLVSLNGEEGRIVHIESELCEAMRNQGFACDWPINNAINCKRVGNKALHYDELMIACDGSVCSTRENVVDINKVVYENSH